MRIKLDDDAAAAVAATATAADTFAPRKVAEEGGGRENWEQLLV